MKKFFWKIQIFVKAIKTLKNWYVFPIVYFNLTKNRYTVFKTRDNFKLKIRNLSSDIQIFTENWLQELYLKQITIKDESTIIDIGAHIGTFATFCTKRYNHCKIYCYEPDQDNFEILVENVKINHLTNINTNNLAVSATEGLIKFYKSSDFSSHSSTHKSEIFEEISSTTLENIFLKNKIEQCSLLKLDCEGAEYEILLTTPQKVLEKISNIVLEYHDFSQKKELLENLCSKLVSNGFVLEKKKINNESGYLYAIKSNQVS